jgi:hypothetical protein
VRGAWHVLQDLGYFNEMDLSIAGQDTLGPDAIGRWLYDVKLLNHYMALCAPPMLMPASSVPGLCNCTARGRGWGAGVAALSAGGEGRSRCAYIRVVGDAGR